VFRPAIKYNSTEIIILHNHPSGNILPSNADLELTERLKNAGQLLGIKVLDHVIFIKGNQFYSFKNDLKLIKA
jgi:DNA repair protein RadC